MHQGILGNGLHRGSAVDRRPHRHHAWRRTIRSCPSRIPHSSPLSWSSRERSRSTPACRTACARRTPNASTRTCSASSKPDLNRIKKGADMKVVVIGASGLIGSKLVSLLRPRGHQVVAASPSTGVNTLTAGGLTEALAGAEVVIDVANSPSFEDKAVMDFFQTSGRNLLAAEATAGVEHHIALSVVGADRLPESGYLRAKVAQEELINIPYTILRSTQFFEFIGRIADSVA